LAVDFDLPLAVLDWRTKSGGCEDAAESGACGAKPLDQGPLRYQLDIDTSAAGQVVLHIAVGALMRRYKACQAAGSDELSDTAVGVSRVVTYGGEVSNSRRDEGIDERLGSAASKEAGYEHGHTRFHGLDGLDR
jgi:hypothetical protein